MRAIVAPEAGSYPYAGAGYANPHAVSQIANGQSTTTYSYDQNGNLAQKTTDGVTTTYLWDYANRLIALGSGGATSTYGYDAFGSRVLIRFVLMRLLARASLFSEGALRLMIFRMCSTNLHNAVLPLWIPKRICGAWILERGATGL